MKQGYVYIVTNKPNGILYLGVTSNLIKRTYEHRTSLYEGFTKKYELKTLVWYEVHDTIESAIAKEKVMKFWKRAWKVKRILGMNPNWVDLWDTINGRVDTGLRQYDDAQYND